MRRVRRFGSGVLASLLSVGLGACSSDEELPAAELDRESQCDGSTEILPGGMSVMYGCAFQHHVYKIRTYGDEVQGDLRVCDADDRCVRRLTYTCERWLLLDDGERSIIVNADTGAVATHGRFHATDSATVADVLPQSLTPPIRTEPSPTDAGP